MGIVYIALVSEGDIGPLQHINAISRYVKGSMCLITNANKKDIEPGKHEFEYISSSFGIIRRQWRVLRCLKSKKCKTKKIVMIRHSAGMILPQLFSWVLRKKIVLEVNGLIFQDLIDRKSSFFARWLNGCFEFIAYKLAAKIILVHENLRIPLKSRYSISDHKFFTLENGVEPIEAVPLTRSKRAVGFSTNHVYLGYLGSLAPREGVDLLLSYFSSTDPKKYKLCIVGDKAESFKQICSDLNIDDQVLSRVVHIPTTGREQALTHMMACDYLVHLRRPVKHAQCDSQGCPLKMLDYLMLKRPILASSVDSYQFIKKRHYGELIDCYSESAFNEALSQLAEGDYKLDDARDFILKQHGWKAQVAKLEEFLNAFSV